MHAETSSTLSLSAPPINRRRLVGLLQEMLGVPSPCGKERRLAIFLAEVMRGMGLRVSCQHVRRRRLNVLGVRPGRAGAPALLLAGRLDTPPPGTDEARCPRRGGRIASSSMDPAPATCSARTRATSKRCVRCTSTASSRPAT
ncbi:MAG: hypothetical protein M5U26_09475 [Planctomycetota bacterium]|nr:hypothetical protein [Planctomycetota bacterium]